MSTWLGFTQNTTDLYVELMTITRYFRSCLGGGIFHYHRSDLRFFKRINYKSRFGPSYTAVYRCALRATDHELRRGCPRANPTRSLSPGAGTTQRSLRQRRRLRPVRDPSGRRIVIQPFRGLAF
jgi:hypothetical protein